MLVADGRFRMDSTAAAGGFAALRAAAPAHLTGALDRHLASVSA
ncbi:hypothetical protein [Amycolatopsis sp. NPDC051102]